MKRQRGFLLIEFLIVLALIVILSGMLALSFVSVAQAKNEQNALQAVKELVASENNWHTQWSGSNNPGGLQYATGGNTHWLTDCTQPATYQASCLASPALLTPGVAYNQFLFSIQDAPLNGYAVYAVPKAAAAGRLGFCGGNNPNGSTNNIIYQFPNAAAMSPPFGACSLPQDVARSGIDQGPAGESIKGEKGIQGEQGIQGNPGIGQPGTNGTNGTNGVAATIDGITAVAVAWNVPPSVTNSGTPQHAVFNFGIPGGKPGTDGQNGLNGGSTASSLVGAYAYDNPDGKPGDIAQMGSTGYPSGLVMPAVGTCYASNELLTDCRVCTDPCGTRGVTGTFTTLRVVQSTVFVQRGINTTVWFRKNGVIVLTCMPLNQTSCTATGTVSVVPTDVLTVGVYISYLSNGAPYPAPTPSNVMWTVSQ